jgi:flavin reductase (DIM6/NTAB) family NADH-FMN oxidoreductase RutF
VTSIDIETPPCEPADPAALAADFRAVFRQHPAGVAVVTADAGNGPVAMTVTSLSSVSADPPLMMFSASAMSSSTPTLLSAASVVVHLLTDDEIALGRLAATSNVNRFADESMWARLPTGEPFYRDVGVRIVADVVNRMPAGQGTVILVRARQITSNRQEDAAPLVYHDRVWHRLVDTGVIAG